MTLQFSQRLSFVMAAALAAGCLVGCDSGGGGSPAKVPTDLPDLPAPDQPEPPSDNDPLTLPQQCSEIPACNPDVQIDSAGAALLVTDPAILADFTLERVLSQILQFQGVDTPPREMMQRLFDTMNTSADGKFADVFHCDSPDNPDTQQGGGDSFLCPRAEGALASSEGFFTAGDPDSFFPVALVNRFDLTPVDGSRCGQYRIIYAKHSGLTDPNDRVFLIFEAALVNPVPGCLEACRPVAELWQGLQGRSSTDIASRLDTFFFTGIPGFKPAVHPLHYGFGAVSQGYGGSEGGQIRVSMHMEDPWDMREMRVELDPSTKNPSFRPTTVKNNPPANMFNPQELGSGGTGPFFREQFVWSNLPTLAGKELKSVQMFLFPELNGVESALAGDKKNDYFAAAVSAGDMTFVDTIQAQIDATGLNAGCPTDDPFDAEAAIHRANVLSCAGCHAPKSFLGEDRSIGCGLTWPDSIGQSHVTEKGQVSPALKDVFLPHRADVLQTFLQACDLSAIQGNLQPGSPGKGLEDFAAVSGQHTQVATLGGSQSH